MDLSAHVLECLHRHGLDGSAGVVGVSGGPDSVALAHVCADLLQQGCLQRLAFAHVNHQLRGDESDADEAFVQDLPARWQLDQRVCCRTIRIDVAALAKAERENLEGIARRERYRWLTDVAQTEGAAWIATGHTADDQAETVLFRLVRGSGVVGLGGMSERRPLGDGVSLIRPLLSARRQALLEYLHDKQIPFRVDSSNRDLRYARNRLRLELLPMLESHYNPAAVEVLCRLADQAQEVSAAIVAQADAICAEAERPRAGDILVFSIDRLQSASANLVREMFRRVWQREGWPMGDMDFESWNHLVEIVHGTCTDWDLPGKLHARRAGSVMQIQRTS